MSAKWNLLKLFELGNNGLFNETYMTENNFSALNLSFLLLDCLMMISCLVIVRITNLYNFVMNSTVWWNIKYSQNV